MNITITKGSLKNLSDCEEALLNSDLGQRYFPSIESASKAVREGLTQETLYIASHHDDCVGFIYYIPAGAFHSFPYIHLISIKKGYRGKGIGTKMMTFLEKLVFEEFDKLFLVVADFNLAAKRFYEKMGYQQVGEIPDLYRVGITEYLMMKKK
ncbi:GNAT family N-acetyltransferase [uncultured Vagococcus sp.]|uniref:GNAT family N-acetyltransferase n=1 Tax=uncultured Vagococcus sp. TaxID=189676 RepID=UPI0028D5FDEB|nr:GNAT family N-acetyltransferase [uncultured Vagococcus sp.]